jgi:hypothetical protein
MPNAPRAAFQVIGHGMTTQELLALAEYHFTEMGQYGQNGPPRQGQIVRISPYCVSHLSGCGRRGR